MDWTLLFPSLSTIQMLIDLDGALQMAQAAMSYYANTVITGAAPIVKSWAVIFMLLYGFAMMRGAIKEPIQDAYVRFFKFAIVIIFAVEFATYNTYVAEFFWDLPKYLTDTLIPNSLITGLNAIVPGTSDLSLMLITVFMSAVVQIMTDGLQASNIGGNTDPTAFAMAMGVGAAGASLTAIVAGILLVAKFSLSILLALGPFFVISILFEKTKHYFDGWLAQIVNFVVVILLLTLTIYILFPVLLIVISSYYLIAQLAGALSLKESVELVTLLGIFIAIIRQVPTTAAALVRGYAIGSPQERSLVGSGGINSGSGKSTAQIQAEQSAQNR